MPTTRYSKQDGDRVEATMVAVLSAKLDVATSKSATATPNRRWGKLMAAPCGIARLGPAPDRDWYHRRSHSAGRPRWPEWSKYPSSRRRLHLDRKSVVEGK